MKRIVFYISDSTGITVETIGRSLLTQFSSLEYEAHTFRFINSEAKALEVVEAINAVNAASGDEQGNGRPIVFSTLVDPIIRDHIAHSHCLYFDVMQAVLQPLADELGLPALPTIGHSHAVIHSQDYQDRMTAVNFALGSDDGLHTNHYDEADVILLGVSRSGKTPTSVFLALHYGINAANYPLVEEDLERLQLPRAIKEWRNKAFGLTITPERLHSIRSERRPDSEYASLRQCQYEIRQVEALYRQFGIKYMDVTRMSVEEIATSIMSQLKLKA